MSRGAPRRYAYDHCYVCVDQSNGDASWTKTWRPRMKKHTTGDLKPGLEAWIDTVEDTWAVLCAQHLANLRAKTALDKLKEGKM